MGFFLIVLNYSFSVTVSISYLHKYIFNWLFCLIFYDSAFDWWIIPLTSTIQFLIGLLRILTLSDRSRLLIFVHISSLRPSTSGMLKIQTAFTLIISVSLITNMYMSMYYAFMPCVYVLWVHALTKLYI